MHVEKFQKNAVGHMLKHYSRSSANFSNKEIDHARSDFNYNLAPKRKQYDIEYYKKRLSEVKCQNRSDVKTLCDWIITLPKEAFTEEQERSFFQSAYDFMVKKYREENVISAWVHKDEAGQAHMHFAFIPICIDKKKGIEKVSAKEVLTRDELRSIHKDMSKYMERIFGYDVGILNGATAGGNKSVIELKTKDLQREIKALEEVKRQSVIEMVHTIKKTPKILSDISKAIKIAMGKEQPQPEQKRNRTYERSR